MKQIGVDKVSDKCFLLLIIRELRKSLRRKQGSQSDSWRESMALAKIERELAAQGKGCLGKAADDEPVFILRAQDALAADLVELWAIRARAANCPVDKVREAAELSEEMRRWPTTKYPD